MVQNQTTWVEIPVLSLTSQMTFGKFNLCVLEVVHLQCEDNHNISTLCILLQRTQVNICKSLRRVSVMGKFI